ncbi:MAG: hypothetical protein GY711_02835 [bacterium]|nr:hypothetical protein [bacterium]
MTLEHGPLVRLSWLGLDALRSRFGRAANDASLAVRFEPDSVPDLAPTLVARLRGGRMPGGDVRLQDASRADFFVQLDVPGRYRVGRGGDRRARGRSGPSVRNPDPRHAGR